MRLKAKDILEGQEVGGLLSPSTQREKSKIMGNNEERKKKET